jgi:molecular chaperone GrpE (heat shock protein)
MFSSVFFQKVLKIGNNTMGRRLFSWIKRSSKREFQNEGMDENPDSGVPPTPEKSGEECYCSEKEIDRKLLYLSRSVDRRQNAAAREFDKMARKLDKSMAKQAVNMSSAVKEYAGVIRGLQDELGKVRAELEGVRSFAMSQQEQLRKYEEGYSWSKVKSFGKRLIRCIDRIDDRIEDQIEDKEAEKVLLGIKDEMIFALEDEGVDLIEPEIGSLFEGQARFVRPVEAVPPENPEQEGTIKEVKRNGYLVQIDDASLCNIIRPAEVVIYRTTKGA